MWVFLLHMGKVNDLRCIGVLRMPLGTFLSLHDWLKEHTELRGSSRVSISQKLATFLWICGNLGCPVWQKLSLVQMTCRGLLEQYYWVFSFRINRPTFPPSIFAPTKSFAEPFFSIMFFTPSSSKTPSLSK